MSVVQIKNAEPVLVERRGAIAIITINRPDSHNAIDAAVRDGLARACDALKGEPSVRCIVFTGAGEEAFSTGADPSEISTMLPAEAAQMAERALDLYARVASLPQPTIAAVKGACVGQGLELALHCDLRLARTDARFGLPGVNVGLVASGAALDLLARTIGAGPAQALALTGGVIAAERAFMLGLVTNVASAAEFNDALDQITDHIAKLPPVAVTEVKRILGLSRAGKPEEARRAGVDALQRCFEESEARTRLRQIFGGRNPEATLH